MRNGEDEAKMILNKKFCIWVTFSIHLLLCLIPDKTAAAASTGMLILPAFKCKTNYLQISFLYTREYDVMNFTFYALLLKMIASSASHRDFYIWMIL